MSKVYSLFLHSIFDNFDRSRKLLFDFGRLPKFSDGSIHCRTLSLLSDSFVRIHSICSMFLPVSFCRSVHFCSKGSALEEVWPIFLISIIVYTISIVFKYS